MTGDGRWVPYNADSEIIETADEHCENFRGPGDQKIFRNRLNTAEIEVSLAFSIVSLDFYMVKRISTIINITTMKFTVGCTNADQI